MGKSDFPMEDKKGIPMQMAYANIGGLYQVDFHLRQEKIQTEFFKDKCGGYFNSAAYPFVLTENYRKENLYSEFADEAIQYFKDNKIVWWRGKDGLPTNHTLSSQVSCINHMLWLQNNEQAATVVLKQLDQDFIAEPFPKSKLYIEFELNGCDEDHRFHCLCEKGSARGANTTSIDAAMLARKSNKKVLVLIEWKYVESYYGTIQGIQANPQYTVQKFTYKPWLLTIDCPILILKTEELAGQNLISDEDFDRLYEKFSVEPIYQLMRQTLLAWKLTAEHRYGADDYLHVHVIPFANSKLLTSKTSPEIIDGHKDICSAWKNCLKRPEKYIHIDPSNLLDQASMEFNPNLHDYLHRRYWQI